MLKRLLAITLAFACCFCPLAVTAEEGGDTALCEPVETINHNGSYNMSRNNYSYYSRAIRSYLVQLSSGGFLRVEPVSDTVFVAETYGADLTLASSKEIAIELPIFGGFFFGDHYNFAVFGQTNSDCADSAEVLRVVKYSKDFTRLGSVSVYGANTTIPFDAGSLRMTEVSGLLYIHTCHEMYSGHQANMSFVIKQDDMTIFDQMHHVMNIGIGYVSHSFNQFIATDGTYIYRVDHGDCYPRSVVVTRCAVGGDIERVIYGDAFDIPLGTLGENYTGVSVGGLALAGDNVYVTGNSVDMTNEENYYVNRRNVFLSIMDKNLQSTTTVWLSEYDVEGTVTAFTPQMVKLAEDRLLIMWEEYDYSTGIFKLCSVTVDSNGAAVTPIVRNPYRLSDCQPILCADGTVKWYVSDYGKTVLYTLAPQKTTPMVTLGDVNGDGSVDNLDAAYILRHDAGIITLSETQKIAADVDRNGLVDSIDSAIVLKYEAGLISSLEEG